MKNKLTTPEEKFITEMVYALNKNYRRISLEIIKEHRRREKELKKFFTSKLQCKE